LRKALGSGGVTGLGLALAKLAKENSYLMKAGTTVNSKEKGADVIFQYTLAVSQDAYVPASQQRLMT
jgi:hypothetical protein